MVVTFLRCTLVIHWLPHTLIQFNSFFFGGLESLVLSFFL